MPDPNPFASPEVSKPTRRVVDRVGTVYDVRDPHPRSCALIADVFYCPPYLGLAARRPSVRLHLEWRRPRTEEPYEHLPYFYELERVPHQPAVLHLYLHRDVQLTLPPGCSPLPSGSTRATGGRFQVLLPRPHAGGRTLTLAVHRHQTIESVPQTPLDSAGDALAPREWKNVQMYDDELNGRLVMRYRVEAYVWVLPTPQGVRLSFGADLWGIVDGRVSSTYRAYPVNLGDLSLDYWNVELPGGFWHRVTAVDGTRLKVEVLHSDNIRSRLRINQAGLGMLRTLGLSLDSALSFTDAYFRRFVDLRVEQRDRTDLPGPSDQPREVRTRYTETDHLEVQQGDAETGEATAISAALGFLPILGDVIDGGQAIYSLVSGRDPITDEELTGWDYLLIGLTLLPLVPGALRKLSRVGGERELVQQARRLAADVGADQRTVRQLARASDRIASVVDERAALRGLDALETQRETRRVIAFGTVRNEDVIDAIARVRGVR